ncbi:hypothetical protein QFC21_005853 [Naganishia friedmannii]|uniref:Uncharacterized protein n=1 Tax=Naganishia friedmannii TaxID=89922 RepID=A0ACC2V798_9TREE|nr:hypothetical protein QFC21_005853 [Naganishia friedmannii]
MSAPSVSSSDFASDANTLDEEEEKQRRTLAKTAIFPNDIALYARRHKPMTIPASEDHEVALLSSTNSEVSMNNGTIKADQFLETMTTEIADIISPADTAVAGSVTETVALGSAAETTASASFLLELTVSEWLPDRDGSGGRVIETKVRREIDIDDPGNLEKQFSSMFRELNPEGRPMPRINGFLEHTVGAFDSAATQRREGVAGSLSRALMRESGDYETKLSLEQLMTLLALAEKAEVGLPADVLAEALLQLKYARALRQVADFVNPKNNREEPPQGGASGMPLHSTKID